MLALNLCVCALSLGALADPLQETADRVVKQINDQQKNIAAAYHPLLLKQVSENQLLAIYADMFSKFGRIVGVIEKERKSPESGEFMLAFEKGVESQLTLVIDAKAPHKIMGILFGPPIESFKDIDSIIERAKELPGTVSMQLARLGDEIKVTHKLNAEESLAIGSAFKLYLLGAIVEHNKPWDYVVRLSDENMSLPSGILHKWPAGSPITLHTLASEMISISDNTATDHVLDYLGRSVVESQLATMGHAHPEQSWPMLKTLEMFKLKSNKRLLKKYVRADLPGRRQLLEKSIKRLSREGLAPFADGTPMAIDKVEWFASAADLCRAMDWFRRKNDATALAVLAINSGVPQMKSEFDYIGFKGGSEPGVLNLTWLLRTKKGTDFALSMGWNNPADEGADLSEFLGLAQATLRLVAKQ